ncbi:hypothetical protein [Photobacterium satsumensis]
MQEAEVLYHYFSVCIKQMDVDEAILVVNLNEKMDWGRRHGIN